MRHHMLVAGTLLLHAIVSSTPAAAQTRAPRPLTPAAQWADSARQLIEDAQGRGDTQGLVQARVLVDRALVAFPNDGLLLHYSGYAFWREASLRLGQREIPAARKLLEQADRALELSARRLPLAETHAVRASVLGQLIGTSDNPLTGMRLGPKSSKEMERAEALGPNNPRVWIIKGLNALYAPKLFGGGPDKAEAHLKRGFALLERDSAAAPNPQWGRVDAYLTAGQVYAKQGRRAEARAAYRKVLELQPENRWVALVLLPAVSSASAPE